MAIDSAADFSDEAVFDLQIVQEQAAVNRAGIVGGSTPEKAET
jgi:hypothetical protein